MPVPPPTTCIAKHVTQSMSPLSARCLAAYFCFNQCVESCTCRSRVVITVNPWSTTISPRDWVRVVCPLHQFMNPLVVADMHWQSRYFKIINTDKQTYQTSSSSAILHYKGLKTCTVLASSKRRGTNLLSYIVNGFRHSTTIAFDHIVLQPFQKSDQRSARASRAAVSNVMVVLRLSNSREASIRIQSQSVRHGDNFQR